MGTFSTARRANLTQSCKEQDLPLFEIQPPDWEYGWARIYKQLIPSDSKR